MAINNNLNYDEIYLSRNENLSQSNKKLLLPKINKDYNFQNNNKRLNILASHKNIKTKLTKNKIFFTLSEEEKNKINNDNKMIIKLLNEKIIIKSNSTSPSEDNKKKLSPKNIILKNYMEEAKFYRRPNYQRKKIHVGIICRAFSFDENKNNLDNYNNNLSQKTLESSNSKIIESVKKLKKIKTQNKNIVLNNYKDYLKPNLKKINCNLQYNYNKNQIKLNRINLIINNLEKKSKNTFDGYRKDAIDLIQKTYEQK